MKYVLTSIAILWFLNLTAQTTTLKVSESEAYKDKVKAKNIHAIHTTANGLTGVIREAKRDILFDIFDKDLNKIFSEVVEIEKKEHFVGELFYDEEIKFFTVYSPKKTERIIYCHIFNLKDRSLKKKKLFETSVEKKQILFSGQNKRQTSFAISPNGEYFAVTTDDIKKNANSYQIRVFNTNDLSLKFIKNFQEDENRFYEHNDLLIDNSATVFALGRLFIDGKSQKKGGDANYEFVLNKISESNIENVNLQLGEQHIQSLNLSVIEDQLHVLGFYSEERSGKIKGGCNFIIDFESLDVLSNKTYELPIEVYEDLYGKKRAERKKGKELKRFYVDYVLKDEDNNTYILAEEFYTVQRYMSTGMNGAGYWVTEFHYDDILVFKFDNTGNLGWGRSIFKKSQEPSYNAFLKNGKLHVLLNSGKNLKEKNDGRTKVSQGFLESSALYDMVFSENGEVSYDKIQDNSGNTSYTPYYGTFENNKFIMTSSRGGKKNQFMILE